MEPVSTALVVAAITAAATSAGNEAGRGVWGSLTALSRRLVHQGAPMSRARPDDNWERLAALADLLVERARDDEEFAADLARWVTEAERLPAPPTSGGAVYNTITGSQSISAPVVMARDIDRMNIGMPPGTA
jgi:hypothetical protein